MHSLVFGSRILCLLREHAKYIAFTFHVHTAHTSGSSALRGSPARIVIFHLTGISVITILDNSYPCETDTPVELGPCDKRSAKPLHLSRKVVDASVEQTEPLSPNVLRLCVSQCATWRAYV
jgi:hypothetical protein